MGYKFFKQKRQVATSAKNEFDFHLDFIACVAAGPRTHLNHLYCIYIQKARISPTN